MADAETGKIMRVYGALAASLILLLLPHVAFCAMALLLFMGVMIVAYVMRGKADVQSLTHDHMTFIIRTIWIGSLFALVTTVIAAVYMLGYADQSPLMPCAEQAMNAASASTPADMKQIDALMQPCVSAYVSANKVVLAVSVLIAGLLPLVYFAYRLAKGLSRARRSHRIGDNKSWL